MSVEYGLKIKKQMKRATIIIEYTTEQNLDDFLDHIKNQLKDGQSEGTKTFYVNQNSFVATFSQVYCENYKRESKIEVHNGVCHEIVKSNV